MNFLQVTIQDSMIMRSDHEMHLLSSLARNSEYPPHWSLPEHNSRFVSSQLGHGEEGNCSCFLPFIVLMNMLSQYLSFFLWCLFTINLI